MNKKELMIKLTEALSIEETDMIADLDYLMNKVSNLDIDLEVKQKLLKIMDQMRDDTLRHARIISKQLMVMLK